jgi:hypothetical protein
MFIYLRNVGVNFPVFFSCRHTSIAPDEMITILMVDHFSTSLCPPLPTHDIVDFFVPLYYVTQRRTPILHIKLKTNHIQLFPLGYNQVVEVCNKKVILWQNLLNNMAHV